MQIRFATGIVFSITALGLGPGAMLRVNAAPQSAQRSTFGQNGTVGRGESAGVIQQQYQQMLRSNQQRITGQRFVQPNLRGGGVSDSRQPLTTRPDIQTSNRLNNNNKSPIPAHLVPPPLQKNQTHKSSLIGAPPVRAQMPSQLRLNAATNHATPDQQTRSQFGTDETHTPLRSRPNPHRQQNHPQGQLNDQRHNVAQIRFRQNDGGEVKPPQRIEYRKHATVEPIASAPSSNRTLEQRSSLISSRVEDQSQVTTARFVIVQEPNDLTQQSAFSASPAQGAVLGNPFADPEPISNSQEQDDDDPFSDPLREQLQNQAGGDPFSRPVDPRNQNSDQDAFGNRNDNLQDVNPFPNQPGDITPPDSLEGIPQPSGDSQQQPTTDVQKPEPPKPREILGPFEEREGFSRTPLLPAPEERLFPDLHSEVITRVAEQKSTADQPTHFGADFDKSQLYQGIVNQNVAADTTLHDSDYCENCQCEKCGNGGPLPRQFAKPRFFKKLTRGAHQSGCTNLNCQTCQNESEWLEDDYQPLITDAATDGVLLKDGQIVGRLEYLRRSWAERLHELSNIGLASFSSRRQQLRNRWKWESRSIGEGDWIEDDCCDSPVFYLSAFGGYNQLEGIALDSFSNVAVPGAPSFPSPIGPLGLTFNDGFGLGFAIGQYQGPNLRTELEFAYRRNDADTTLRLFRNPNPSPTFLLGSDPIEGSIDSYSGMFNALWDFSPRPIFGNFRPYAGGGVGFSFVDPNLPESALTEDNESQSSFAYQLIAGVSRPINAQVHGFAEYRYFNADPIRVLANGRFGDTEIASENIFFGVRFQF